jgi:hypothetical protein
MNNFSPKIDCDQYLHQYLHLKENKNSLEVYILYVNVIIKLNQKSPKHWLICQSNAVVNGLS